MFSPADMDIEQSVKLFAMIFIYGMTQLMKNDEINQPVRYMHQVEAQ
jgi:hypothetical protein